MAIRKVQKTMLDFLVSGKRWGDSDKLLLALSVESLRPQQCNCTLEEYNEYVLKAKRVYNEKKMNNDLILHIDSWL